MQADRHHYKYYKQIQRICCKFREGKDFQRLHVGGPAGPKDLGGFWTPRMSMCGVSLPRTVSAGSRSSRPPASCSSCWRPKRRASLRACVTWGAGWLHCRAPPAEWARTLPQVGPPSGWAQTGLTHPPPRLSRPTLVWGTASSPTFQSRRHVHDCMSPSHSCLRSPLSQQLPVPYPYPGGLQVAPVWGFCFCFCF